MHCDGRLVWADGTDFTFPTAFLANDTLALTNAGNACVAMGAAGALEDKDCEATLAPVCMPRSYKP